MNSTLIASNKGFVSPILKKKYGANDLGAWSPEIWANETLAILNEELFAPNLVHRNFENLMASKGHVVHTRRPNEFRTYRKTDNDSVTVQDLTATDVAVPLDQHLEVSFKVRDEEWSKGLPQLIETHMKPAAIALARDADKIIFGQYPKFLMNGIGKLGGATSANIKEYLVYLRQKMNDNKAYNDGRNLVLNNSAESLMLLPEFAFSAEKAGTTEALRNGTIGRLLGFDLKRSNNMAFVLDGNTQLDADTLINMAAGAPIGTTTITIDGNAGDAYPDGVWVSVDGLPNIVVSSTTTSIVLRWPLTRFVADNAPVFGYTAGQINLGAGYAAGYDKEIVVDTFTVAPQVGQSVSFGVASPSTTAVYTIKDVTGLTGITLDRALEAAVVDDAKVNIGPPGGYSFAFHKNAIAFVNRPLNLPMRDLGVRAAVMNLNGIAIRVLMQYIASGQYTLVTFDLLCGVKELDTDLGAVLLT